MHNFYLKVLKTPIFCIIALLLFFFFQSCNNDPFDANSGTFTDKRDNHVYEWVKIGDQIWMAENIAYAPHVCAPDSQCGIWVYGYQGKGSFYDNYSTYGCLYDWETAKKVCPEGWHLPSHAEWTELERFLGMPEDQLDRLGIFRGEEENIGGKLKEKGTMHWEEPNEGATDEYGFSALPGGCKVSNIRYTSLKSVAFFWTSTEDSKSYALSRMLYNDAKTVWIGQEDKSTALSVRCIKD